MAREQSGNRLLAIHSLDLYASWGQKRECFLTRRFNRFGVAASSSFHSAAILPQVSCIAALTIFQYSAALCDGSIPRPQ